jgi:hypothetical protein
LPGGLVLGNDNAIIESTALQNRIRLQGEIPHPSWFVATQEDGRGKILGTFIIQAERTIEAIEKIEQDVGRHLWLTNGGDHVVGLPNKLALSIHFIALQKIRKENCLLQVG